MKTPLLSFLYGTFLGAAIATIIVLHIVTNQVQERNAMIIAGIDSNGRQWQETRDMALRTVAAWQQRAETCEAKFTVATVVYQDQPIASVPFLHGTVALQVAPGAGNAKPSLVIPAQVEVFSQRPDIQYQWLDGRTGEPKSIITPAKTAVQ